MRYVALLPRRVRELYYQSTYLYTMSYATEDSSIILKSRSVGQILKQCLNFLSLFVCFLGVTLLLVVFSPTP